MSASPVETVQQRSPAVTYTRYELLRAFRNRRFLVFAYGFPLVLYFLIAGPNRNEASISGSGIPAPLYYMVGLATFGTMTSMLSTGARIAGERAVGWNRQLQITPLTTRNYFRAKLLTGYALALSTLLLLYAAGVTLGVSLPASGWARMTFLMLAGLLPFAPMGVTMGHLLSTDAIGPAMGGLTALFAFLGGVWFPIDSGFLYDVARCLPSYWLVQASHVGLGGEGWGATGWFVMIAWTAGFTAIARYAFRRDTARA